MRRYLYILIGFLISLIVAGWIVSSTSARPNLSSGAQQDEVFGEIYLPFAQRSPEELNRALQSVPPPKPAPVLSVDKAQSYLPFKLALAQCPSLMTLEGVQLTKEIFPDGEVGQILTRVIYEHQGKQVILNETLSSPADKFSQPKGATEITLNNGTAWLLENWVPGKTEIWWMKDNLRLALSVDRTTPKEDSIDIANCVQ